MPPKNSRTKPLIYQKMKSKKDNTYSLHVPLSQSDIQGKTCRLHLQKKNGMATSWTYVKALLPSKNVISDYS